MIIIIICKFNFFSLILHNFFENLFNIFRSDLSFFRIFQLIFHNSFVDFSSCSFSILHHSAICFPIFANFPTNFPQFFWPLIKWSYFFVFNTLLCKLFLHICLRNCFSLILISFINDIFLFAVNFFKFFLPKVFHFWPFSDVFSIWSFFSDYFKNFTFNKPTPPQTHPLPPGPWAGNAHGCSWTGSDNMTAPSEVWGEICACSKF